MRPIKSVNTQKSGNPANISTLGISFVLHSCAVSCICACLTDRSGNGVIIAWCLNQLTVHSLRTRDTPPRKQFTTNKQRKSKFPRILMCGQQYRLHTMSKSVTNLDFPSFKMLAGFLKENVFFRMRRRVKEKEKKQEASI